MNTPTVIHYRTKYRVFTAPQSTISKIFGAAKEIAFWSAVIIGVAMSFTLIVFAAVIGKFMAGLFQ